MSDINTLASEFDRLAPSSVDETTAGNGQQMSGHIGYDDNDEFIVGWYDTGGNTGCPVIQLKDEASVKLACERLAKLPDAAIDNGSVNVQSLLSDLTIDK